MIDKTKVWFFGPWNEPGHYWRRADLPHDNVPEPYVEWIDGGYQPRRWKAGYTMYRHLVRRPDLCWAAEGTNREDRHQISHDTTEWDQGIFLVHHLPYGTLMSWWDRTQGDTRGACNANLLVVGDKLDAERMCAVLAECFPHVIENLARGGVAVLREASL